MNEYPSFKNCIVCESEQLEKLKNFQRAYLCKCRNCGMVFTQRIPTAQELESYYSNYGSTHYLSELTIKRYHELLDMFEKFRQTNNILDVGCGGGFLLRRS